MTNRGEPKNRPFTELNSFRTLPEDVKSIISLFYSAVIMSPQENELRKSNHWFKKGSKKISSKLFVWTTFLKISLNFFMSLWSNSTHCKTTSRIYEWCRVSYKSKAFKNRCFTSQRESPINATGDKILPKNTRPMRSWSSRSSKLLDAERFKNLESMICSRNHARKKLNESHLRIWCRRNKLGMK